MLVKRTGKLLGAFLVLGCTFPSLAYGQGAFVSGSAQGTVNGALRSLPGATVTVCAANTTGIPCAPPLAGTLFKDAALTQPLANPTTTDANGNYNFAVAAGTYTLTITSAGFTGSTQQITVTCGTGGCTATSLTIAGPLAVTGTATFTGTSNTFVNLNNTVWICNTIYACTDAGLQAAQNTLTSGGTIIIPLGSGPTISNTVNINNPNVTIMGMGPASSIQVALAGDVFNVTNSRFRLHDLEIGLPTTTRTGAIVHASSSGAVIGNVYNLDIVGSASSTNNGHFFLLDSANANQWNFAQIYMPRGTTWTSAFKFSNGSGVATASGFKIQGFIGGASFTDAGIVVDGAIDTLQVMQSSWNNDIGGGKAIDVRNTVAGFINPRFIYFNQVSPEAVTGTVLNISAGRQVHYQNSYCANTNVCAAVGASAIDTDFSHNTVATIQQSVVTVAAGALRTIISYNDIQDPGQQTSNTYDAISIAANATDVTVAGNVLGCAGSPFARFGANILPGTSTRIKIIDNNFPNSCMGTAGISNSGTGADIIVRNNTEIQNDGPIKLFEVGAPPTFANQDVCYGDSTAHALKCSYNNGSFFNQTQTIGTGNVTTAGTAVNTLTCQAQTNITVTGAATTDNVIANIGAVLPATWQTGIVLSAHVTATNTVTVYLCNPTATATITPAATQVNVRVMR